jgi:lipopolysaccharide export system permease protein
MAAAKAGGISFYRALRMLPVLGLLLTLVGLALSELVPVTERLRRQALGEVESSGYARSDFVYASEGESYAVQRLDTEGGGIIRGVTVERPGDLVNTPSIHIVSDEAVYDTARGSWTLRNGRYRMLLDDTTEHMVQFAELRSPGFRETPEQLTARPKEPEEMRYAELGEYIEILQRSGNKPLKLMVERLQKIAIPVATLIIVLFGAPLANSSSRGGPAYGIGISLGITIVYLMMFKVTEAAGSTGALPIWAAAWLPNLFFAVAGVILLWRIRT